VQNSTRPDNGDFLDSDSISGGCAGHAFTAHFPAVFA
jgi:hypothetical protein